MIRVTVEIDAYGEGKNIYRIAEAIIYNDGTVRFGESHNHNYNASFVTEGRDNVKYQSRVEGFDRRKDVWQLIELALIHKRETEEAEERVRRHLHSERDRQGS
jgi:hypothetical protein